MKDIHKSGSMVRKSAGILSLVAIASLAGCKGGSAADADAAAARNRNRGNREHRGRNVRCSSERTDCFRQFIPEREAMSARRLVEAFFRPSPIRVRL